MIYLRRLFGYVWPQWHRLVIVLISILIITIFYAGSFMMIIPMLKVMMSQEGPHGYVDRKICSDRYGLKFSVPDQVESLDPNKPDITYHLLITNIEKNSLAEVAGLKRMDYIVAVDINQVSNSIGKTPSVEMLAKLAAAPGGSKINLRFKRFNEQQKLQLDTTQLETGGDPFYLDTVIKLLSFIPVHQTKDTKVKAMTVVIIIISIFTVIRCIGAFIQKYMGAKITFTAVANLRADTFGHIIEMPAGFFASRNPSDAVSRLQTDTSTVAIGIDTLLGKALREPSKAIGLLCVAMWLDFKLTLIFLFAAPPTIWAVARLGKRIKRATKKSLASAAQMLGKLTEAFSSIKVIKVYNQQPYENQQFAKVNQSLLKHQLKVSKIDAATNPIMEVVGMAAGCAALLFGVHWVVGGGLESAEFLTLIVLLGTAGESIRKGSDVWNKLQQTNAASERVFSILDKEVEWEKPDAVKLPRLNSKIEFSNIYFTYPDSDEPVIHNVNLTIEAGHNIAIVGPNGSGKTTLVNLLPRFYDADSGTILIDGHDIRDCTLKSLRDQIAMVTQRTVTFNDTIAANIGYGRTGTTMDQIITAAERAYAHEFITQLPNRYETVIGEQGTGLSGGQLQRIVIARAILKDPPILIFDEATSQIDAESEAKIHSAIEDIMHNRTSFIIAHRFSTIVSADMIVVMDKGQIVAQGRHEELIKSCPLYQNLYETQLVKA